MSSTARQTVRHAYYGWEFLVVVPRGSLLEQRAYLHDIDQDFTRIVCEAIEADYEAAFFGDAFSKTNYSRRIRGVVQNLIDEFGANIRSRGQMYEIVEDGPSSTSSDDCDEELLKEENKPLSSPVQLSRRVRLAQIAEHIRPNRGQELPVFPKESTITALFREQCRPWVELVKQSGKDIFAAVRSAILELVAAVVLDTSTQEGVLTQIVSPALEDCRVSFEAASDKALHQHVNGHPITFNQFLAEKIQKLRDEHVRGVS